MIDVDVFSPDYLKYLARQAAAALRSGLDLDPIDQLNMAELRSRGWDIRAYSPIDPSVPSLLTRVFGDDPIPEEPAFPGAMAAFAAKRALSPCGGVAEPWDGKIGQIQCGPVDDRWRRDLEVYQQFMRDGVVWFKPPLSKPWPRRFLSWLTSLFGDDPIPEAGQLRRQA